MMARSHAVALALVLALPSGALAQQDVLLAQNTRAGDGQFSQGGTSVSSQIEAQRGPTPDSGGGPAVDASGAPAEDPTANVIALQRAATQRQDDLREASERFILAQIEAAETLNALRAENGALLRGAESRRIDDLGELRAELQLQIQGAEAKRIDAIRAVDVNASQVQSERATEQAAVLAQQVQQSAETLRALVATTATTVATAQEQLSNALSGRIAALEQAQYVGQGRQTLSDPAIEALAVEVKRLASAQSESVGTDTGSAATIAYIFAGIGALVGLMGIGGFLWKIAQSANGNGNGYPPPMNRRKAAA